MEPPGLREATSEMNMYRQCLREATSETDMYQSGLLGATSETVENSFFFGGGGQNTALICNLAASCWMLFFHPQRCQLSLFPTPFRMKKNTILGSGGLSSSVFLHRSDANRRCPDPFGVPNTLLVYDLAASIECFFPPQRDANRRYPRPHRPA